MFENLQAWVASYYEREDQWSYHAHRKIFDGFTGRKREYTSGSPVVVALHSGTGA